ncbi:MAG TPA: DoxX family protein [Fodinibius sp.]|nr:DoxX family protein [Fodinibius sp.]
MLQPEVHQYIIAALFAITGTLHFIIPKPFISIVPAVLSHRRRLVYLSGAAEIAGAIGLLIPSLQIAAAWGLILLLVAVFPANINMTVQSIRKSGWASWYSLLTLLRLPLQFVLIFWIYWACLSA